MIDNAIFSNDPNLQEGDVALVWGADGKVRVVHNIASVRETGVIKGAEGTGFILAMAAIIQAEQNITHDQAISRAATYFDGLSFPVANDTIQ